MTETGRTDAHPAADVDGHPGGALAEEGARRVDAFAVDADAGKDLTLVHVWRRRTRLRLTHRIYRGGGRGAGPYLRRRSLGLWQSLWCRLDLKRAAHAAAGSRGATRLAGMQQAEQTNDLTFFTFAAGAVPGFPQGGAAVGLERGPVNVDLAAVIDNLEPAGALGRLCFAGRHSAQGGRKKQANAPVWSHTPTHRICSLKLI